MKKIMSSLSLGLVILCMLLSRAYAETPSYDQPWRPQYHFTPPRNFMNEMKSTAAKGSSEIRTTPQLKAAAAPRQPRDSGSMGGERRALVEKRRRDR